MVKKPAHPDIQLFEYLNGALDATAVQAIEAHLSVCEDCASAAAMIRALKEEASASNLKSQISNLKPESQISNLKSESQISNLKSESQISNLKSESHISNLKSESQISNLKPESQISNLKSESSGEHPDISELASFFYAKSRLAENTHVAAHVALCGDCAEAIGEYARAESAAAAYTPLNAAAGAVPARAWEMIRDWEDSSFAKLKPANEVIGQELLARLSLLFDETQNARDPDYIVSGQAFGQTQQAERIPVLVVSSSGEVRSVEYFDKVVDSTGASVLRHAEGSERFDNKLFHVLLHSGEREPVVASDLISRCTIRLHREARPAEKSFREDYFIIED